jgi:hypothetical protein
MENKPTPNSDFEKFLRQHLQQLNTRPDDNTWAQIAEKQHARNIWLQIRRSGIYVVPLLVASILAVAAWWHCHKPAQTPASSPLEKEYQNVPSAPIPPIATDAPHAPQTEAVAQIPEPRYGGQVNTVPAAVVRFQAEKGVRYQSPVTGTTVHIPANSLVDANGIPVGGEVDLMLREYRNAADFLASGIPMHYTDERGDFFFNSGGMFEVRVNQRGKPLQMTQGQTFDVAFSPTAQLTKASLYYLDDASGAWGYQPDPAFVAQKGQTPSLQPPVATEEEVLRNNRRKNSEECLPEITELRGNHDDLAMVLKEAVQTGQELATGKLQIPLWFRKNPGLTNEQLLNGLERGQVRIVQHKDQDELFFPEDLSNIFTELAAFKDCYFTRTLDSLNGGRGKRRLNPDERWQRVTVAQEKGAYCQIALYGENTGWMQFYATLTSSIENKNFDAEKVLAEYRRLRTERQNNFEARIAQLRNFLSVAPAFQTQEELCMEAASAWLEYFEENHSMMAKRYEALIKAGFSTNDSLALSAWNVWQARIHKIKLARYERLANARNNLATFAFSLRLKGFGTYNYDQIFPLSSWRERVEFVEVEYRTPDGNKIASAFVSVMERSSRLYFTLPSVSKIPLIPGRRFDFVVTDRDGRQYHLPAEQYVALNLNEEQHNIVTVQDVTDQSRTPLEWAKLLEM